jgi:type II secretory ATPase GspE/PulE/Tfp pilus assembly ATPase PilB-like protein
MRQDPDAILVGEIRDKETAGIAIQAALTGHLVFSTVHANSSVGAVPRLIDLGVRVASIGPALNLVIAQRLVRRLCPKCKKLMKIDSAMENKIRKFLNSLPERVDREPYKQFKAYEAKGCKECGNLGYRGRLAVFELLLVGPEMENLIKQEVSEVAIKEFALKHGLVEMQGDGILKVLAGETSFDEVQKTTGPLKW